MSQKQMKYLRRTYEYFTNFNANVAKANMISLQKFMTENKLQSTNYGRKDLYSTAFQTKTWPHIPGKKKSRCKLTIRSKDNSSSNCIFSLFT